MSRAWRWTELRLLIPVLILVPLGFAVTHVAQTNRLDPGPLWLALGYLALVLGAHVVLAASGHRGDELLLPIARGLLG